jgi:undecaprenyl diphosphate synthase
MNTMHNRLEHIAFIMDGNGRWAKGRGLQRTKGHEQGAETIRTITSYCAKHPEIQTATFYAFSTENWKRPKLEVEYLMNMLGKYLESELETYQEHEIAFKVIGDISAFSTKLQEKIMKTERLTKANKKLTQVLALNYGSRTEITYAVNRLLQEGKKEITEEELSSKLQTPYSDIDLLIRTSGELRLSNFLLWQLSYAELHFTQTHWPDFTAEELGTIVTEFKQRSRRFGGLQ